ncbi:3-polyprenyl-4-hydroxybenzoate decarboxylase [Leptospira ryugenii]|uniref:Flavin prenyltransferase UbiX n=1 Tax=Leptospira ryugenii TaxID=1917863 RepID=A0A2P2DYU9_9LEPT|nr:UbiX family flavin prenyltransferase [Leptospira ryugenii]GBF49809.1 3-polyprenyl-4-hydroxybenzoate decarboxylase [Leptospira ryugenii]
MRLVVGLAGASGSIYAARFIRALSYLEGETFLIVSPPSLRIFSEEYETQVKTPEDILAFLRERYGLGDVHSFKIRNFHDIGADIASGSNAWDAMVVVPCSMKSVASIHAGFTENLIERAADVSLKERRRLVLVPRETPYNRIHLRNMLALDEAGAIILPASPGFYQMPKTLEDLGDFIAGRILGLLGIEHQLFPKWEG